MPPRKVVYDKATQVKQRKRKKKRRLTFMLACFIFMLVAIGIVVSILVFFKVDKLEVQGKTIYSNEQIISISGIKKGQNLLGINKKAAALALREKLPYIKSADIELQPLSTVIIHIVQDEPISIAQNNNQFIILDKSMKVLEVRQDNNKSNLTVIKGLNIKSNVAGRLLIVASKQLKLLTDFYNAIDENKFDKSKINSFDITDEYQLVIRYDNRINILIGTETNIDFKLATAKFILTKNIESSKKGKLDVSNADPNSSDARNYFDVER
jgi:cell division protein FtsQ